MKPLRKRHQERRQLAGEPQQPTPDTGGGVLDVREWRQNDRYEALVDFARRTKGLKWSKTLFLLLLEELFIADEFHEIIGRPDELPPGRHTQALAFAVALRHSWWPENLHEIANLLTAPRSRRARPRSRT